MDLRHLRYFLAVADELHFRRAAERIHISQPALSQAVRELEDELAVSLFIRTTRRVELTEEGRSFRRDALRILADLDVAADRARAVASGQIAELAIGFVGIATNMGLAEAIRAYHAAAPQVRLHLEEAPSAQIERNVVSGTVDVGFIRIIDRPIEVSHHRLFRDEEPFKMLVVNPHSPEPQIDAVPLK